jgi:hypothetical protein
LPARVIAATLRHMSKCLVLLFAALLACGSARADDSAATQRGLVDAQVAKLDLKATGAPRVFFLGFAGVGEERVFAEEIKLAAKVVGDSYGSASRSVLLLNDRRDLTTYPLASESSLRYALGALGRVMNREEDVLFLALSSHGSPDATIDVSNEGMEPQPLGAVTLAELLADSGIRWKVIVVSACFSGAFIPPLADNHTIILTAASKSRTSFGCSDTRYLTYFGEAFYRDSLPGSAELRAAFEAAKKEIRHREKEEDVRASQPQGYFGPLMEEKLRAIEQSRAPITVDETVARLRSLRGAGIQAR